MQDTAYPQHFPATDPQALPVPSNSEVRRVTFEVVLSDESTERVEGADNYAPEGPLTTFFDNQARPGGISAWSVKVASYRTSDIIRIRRA